MEMIINNEKINKLKNIISEYAKNDFALAFSGGVDSSLLLYLAMEAAGKTGVKVYAVTVNTELHPACDLEIARSVATAAGAEHIVLELNELTNESIVTNPVDRCYLCKRMLFNSILDTLKNKNVYTLLEGTNLEDTYSYRPGIKAIKELGVKSPLLEAEFMKDEVRELAKMYGIKVHNRPSTPCLATRFPYGTRLSYENLKRVEAAENILKEYYSGNIRARVHDNILRIEVDKNIFLSFLEKQDELTQKLKRLGYDYITLDLEGFRSGSMDIGVNK